MRYIYPTVHNRSAPYGVPFYELRGDQAFPTRHNKIDPPDQPAFQKWKSLLFPTVQNQRWTFGLPVYEIRGSKLYPTGYNLEHAQELPAFEIREDGWEAESVKR